MSQSFPPYRDYLDEAERGTAPEVVPVGEPTPGRGTVFVQKFSDGTWHGSWQENYEVPREDGAVAGVADCEGTEGEVLRWARSRPAARFLIFSVPDGDYVPLAGVEDD
ncbi:hypothetical protein [Actinomadura hibisca]|uniref:hypothetical protein n=1 Tax=Actinomadura hibisca TaxID=68565 RepID=UPI00082D075D|nr:hypothetical protein [Actinomadura hibisca]